MQLAEPVMRLAAGLGSCACSLCSPGTSTFTRSALAHLTLLSTELYSAYSLRTWTLPSRGNSKITQRTFIRLGAG